MYNTNITTVTRLFLLSQDGTNKCKCTTGRESFDQHGDVQALEVRTKHHDEEAPLTDEELLLASPIVYGFSLSDKIWCRSPIVGISQ